MIIIDRDRRPLASPRSCSLVSRLTTADATVPFRAHDDDECAESTCGGGAGGGLTQGLEVRHQVVRGRDVIGRDEQALVMRAQYGMPQGREAPRTGKATSEHKDRGLDWFMRNPGGPRGVGVVQRACMPMRSAVGLWVGAREGGCVGGVVGRRVGATLGSCNVGAGGTPRLIGK
jgi:hypothetical protein